MKWWTKQLPIHVGCTPAGPACDHCWAKSLEDGRLRRLGRCRGYSGSRADFAPGQDEYFWRGPVYQGIKTETKPVSWRKPQVIAVDLCSDLFHVAVPRPDIHLAYLAGVAVHTFIVLTKRYSRMRDVLLGMSSCASEYQHCHFGASVWNQESCDDAIAYLSPVRAAGFRTFLSMEPMLGPVTMHLSRQMALSEIPGHALNDGASSGIQTLSPLPVECVILGGESGKGARPMHPDWVRTIRDECAAAGVPFLFKQWGDAKPLPGEPQRLWQVDKEIEQPMPCLDGRIHADFPWREQLIAATKKAKVNK